MNRSLKLSVVLLLGTCAAATAQVQVSDNVNVLPVYRTLDAQGNPADDGFDFVRGNYYGQSINESSRVAVSSVNKDHRIVFFNDYRAVAVPADLTVPASRTARFWKPIKEFFARLTGRPTGESELSDPDYAAFGVEAGVGCSVTYDGGLTWSGCWVPGLQFDTSPASLKSPVYAKQMQGVSDPVTAVGACGRVHMASVSFNRDTGASQVTYHQIQDLNDSDTRHTWKWVKTKAVQDTQNINWGQQLDKVAIATRLRGESDCSKPTEDIAITYTLFTGKDVTKFQAKTYMALSTDNGDNWLIYAVDSNYTQPQGTAIAVNQYTGDIHVIFRSFNPQTVVLRTLAKGASKFGAAVDVLAASPTAMKTLAKYDQPVANISNPNGPAGLQYRSNGFPSLDIFHEYDAAGAVKSTYLFETHHELADPTTGLPSLTGVPRVMCSWSSDGGKNWSARFACANGQNPAQPVGLGYFSPSAGAAGPQLQPSVACGPRGCLLTYYEARGGTTAGYGTAFDLRGVQIKVNSASSPAVTFTPSFQVSRYSYRGDLPANVPLTDSLNEIDRLFLPNGAEQKILSYANFPIRNSGQEPFFGDYQNVAPLVDVVKDPVDGKWRKAKPGDAGDATFVTSFSDNRFVVQPYQYIAGGGIQPGDMWRSFNQYAPPGTGASCVNPRARAQTVLTAEVNAGVVVTAPSNYKDFSLAPTACNNQLLTDGSWTGPQSACVEFPMTVWNNSSTGKRYRITLSGNGSFAKDPSTASPTTSTGQPNPDYYQYKMTTGGVAVYPYSSSSVNVYAFDANPVTVYVTECPTAGCASLSPSAPYQTSITFNGPGAAPTTGTTAGTYSASNVAITTGTRNTGTRNTGTRNTGTRNTGTRNTGPVDAVVSGQTVYNTIDYSWTITPTNSGDVGTYYSLLNIDPAYAQDYVFTVQVTKPLTSYTTSADANCVPLNQTEGTIVANFGDQSNPLVNTGTRNTGTRNTGTRNTGTRNPAPTEGDPYLQNTSFTLGSTTEQTLLTTTTQTTSTSTSSGAATLGCDPNTGMGLVGECTLAAPRLPNNVIVTVRAFQVTPTATILAAGRPLYDPDGRFDQNGNPCSGSTCNTPSPPSVGVAEYSCVPGRDAGCVVTTGPDLVVVPQTPSPDDYSPTKVVPRGSSIPFPTASVTIKNAGQECTGSTVSCATARPHRWGIYLSTASSVAQLPPFTGDTIQENLDPTKGPITMRLKTGDFTVPVPVGGSEVISTGGAITIPSTTPLGIYYIYIYVDDTRVVSEIDETNNYYRGGPIQVVEDVYGFIGLQTPCDVGQMTCTKSGNGAVPLAWQFSQGGVAVDSASVQFDVRFYACTATVDPSNPATGMLQYSDPATSVTTGNSGFQYFGLAGLVRPQYSWQFNWDRPNPPFTVPGCYKAYIEVRTTGQVFGSSDPKKKPIGPITINLQ